MTGIDANRVLEFFQPRETKLATLSVQSHKEIYDAQALEKRVKINISVTDYEDLSSKLQGYKLPSQYK